MEVCGQLYIPTALPAGNETAIRVGYEDGWAPQPIWTRCRREKSLLLPEIYPDRSARSVVSMLTKQSRL